jgi:hypothetical protein
MHHSNVSMLSNDLQYVKILHLDRPYIHTRSVFFWNSNDGTSEEKHIFECLSSSSSSIIDHVLSTSESYQATGENIILPPFYLKDLSGNRKKFNKSRVELHI